MNEYKNPIDQLIHSTVRIECQTPNGLSTGSGYFFNFLANEQTHVPCIVTNKHVIADSTKGKFNLTIADSNNKPKLGEHTPIEFGNDNTHFKDMWIAHPEQNIDLAIFLLAPLLTQAKTQGITFHRVCLSKDCMATTALLNTLTTMEEIIMIGYPNGLWDKKHNLPIIRRGITATHPKLSLNDKPEFMIDASCFPGSSGSPVFLANIGSYLNEKGSICMGTRIAFLGTLYAGHQHSITGEIQVVEIPTANIPISRSSIPNNTGLIIQACKLLDFEPILHSKMSMIR